MGGLLPSLKVPGVNPDDTRSTSTHIGDVDLFQVRHTNEVPDTLPFVSVGRESSEPGGRRP